jgi:hypothetical protein
MNPNIPALLKKGKEMNRKIRHFLLCMFLLSTLSVSGCIQLDTWVKVDDIDGVATGADKCPNTPEKKLVDGYGCALASQ